jgi:hypothetical protein
LERRRSDDCDDEVVFPDVQGAGAFFFSSLLVMVFVSCLGGVGIGKDTNQILLKMLKSIEPFLLPFYNLRRPSVCFTQPLEDKSPALHNNTMAG